MKTTLIRTISRSFTFPKTPHGGKRPISTPVLVLALGLALVCLSPGPAAAQNAYTQHNLVSDIPGMADHTDTNLVNPWGITASGSSPFWVSDNHAGLSTLYNGSGVPQTLIVTIPPPAGGTPPAAPSGIIFNGGAGFSVGSNAPARFIFSTEDGAIVGWANATGPALKVDNSAAGTVYKGLAIASNGTNTYLYATDFHGGKVDVFDTNYNAVTLAGSFADPAIPAGFAPFGIQAVNGQLFVTYALQDANKHDDLSGPGNGYVNIFDPNGNLIQRFFSSGVLNSPWGVVKAPASFGPFGGALLIGNFGDGTINAFDLATGAWLGALNDAGGSNPIVIQGLWGLTFGNGGNGGSTGTLYFTAGIPGSGVIEDHGLFGSVAPVFPAVTTGAMYLQHNLVSDLAGMADFTDTNLVNPWGIAFSGTSPFWISDNHAGLSTLYNGSGAPQSLIVHIPPPADGAPPAAPTGIIFNSTTNFTVGSNAPARFIFATEDGTISGWNSGTNAALKVDNSAAGTVYKGLAVGTNSGGSYLFATDFHGGKVDAFDSGYNPAALAGGFADATIPAGFAPFGIENINGQLFVTYAMQDVAKHDDLSGPGNGFVNVFDTSGHLLRRFASGGVLNSPWGLAMAPPGFGAFAGAVLVANFGDGRINAFNPTTGTWLGLLENASGSPSEVEGLWAIKFGNGGNGGDARTLYFTAGIPGGGIVEDHGLFGSLAPVIPALWSLTPTSPAVALNWAGGTGPFLVQQKGSFSDTNWINVFTTTNRNALLALNGQTGFFRLLNQATNNVLAFTALLNGASEVPAVTTPATGVGTFSIEGSNLTYYITFSGLTGPATASHIHGAATPLINAGVIIPFTVPSPGATAGTISGTAVLTPSQMTDITNGMAYANIHTGANPGGEIRGQLVPLHLTVPMSGASEVPPVTPSGTGTASLTFVGSEMFYTVTYSGLSSAATASHLHGPADTSNNAPVLIPFTTPTGTSGSISGSAVLTPTELGYLLSGQTYVNLHTTMNQGGEIRGQVLIP
jgi:uncharacterized protein (TIGR03118 family)